MFSLVLDSSYKYDSSITDSQAKLLVLEPKILMSCTTLTESYTKKFDYYKKIKIKNTVPYKNPAIFGKMIHLIFSKMLGTKTTEKAIFGKNYYITL
jgi:hypothetical protein